MIADLQQFVEHLERAGELVRVRAEVSPLLEISEIAQRQCREMAASSSETAHRFDPRRADRGGRAVLFERVEGADLPVVVNLFGSYRRTEMALGCEASGGFAALASRIESLLKPVPPGNLREALGRAREFLPLLRVPPRLVRRGICQEVIQRTDRGEVDLLRLPLIQCWPKDGDPAAVGYGLSPEQAGTARGQGRYITFAGVHTIHASDLGRPRPASHNIGMYRLQLVDGQRLAMHWHMHHDGAAHWRSFKELGEPMPVAICFGGEAVLPYAATAPLPPGVGELLMAGFLNGRGIPLVRAVTVPLRVPANSELVIEGYVSHEAGFPGYDPRADRDGRSAEIGPGAVFEGPFGDHTGFYSLPDRYPLVRVTAITRRRHALFPATVVGPPPQEDYYLGKATERIFLPPLRLLAPDVLDYHLPMFGCFHNCAFVRIKKQYPLQARRVMVSLWGAGQMAWTKYIVVVDDDVDVHDEAAVLRALLERCHFGRDLERINGPLDILDHAASRLGAGSKLGFDATRKIAGEEVNGVPLESVPRIGEPGAFAEAAARDLCDRLVGQAGIGGIGGAHLPSIGRGRLLILGIEPGPRLIDLEALLAAVERNSASSPFSPELIVIVDAALDLKDPEQVSFRFTANTDPGRDLFQAGGRIVFDATTKQPGDLRFGQPVRDFPPLLEMSAEIRERVDRRWSEYGF